MGIPNLTICYGGELKEEISLHSTSLREISYICAMETVNTSENIKEVVFNGVKYRLMGKKRYYLASHSTNKDRIGAKGLHTAIWEYFNNREVPKGYCIHHIDGNPFNNDISNLQCMEIGEHCRLHAEKNNKNEDYVRQRNETLKRASNLAREWHKSDVGRKWHSENARNRVLKDKKIVCKCCGKEFVSPYADTQFCSDKCGYKYRRNYVLNYTGICKECGIEFKYGKGYSSEKDRQFCSLSCRTKYNNKHRNK